MRFVLRVLAVLTVTAWALPAPADPDLAAADAAMARVFEQGKTPGASFAVGYGGRVVDAKGYGFADRASRSPVTVDTLFALASASKPITAMAVMKLVDEGKLTLDTAAFAFLGLDQPADPRAASITIKNLLNHSSGLPRDVPGKTDDPLDTARAAARSRLQFAPGTQQVYSNAGFNVLGAIIEKASGQSYVDYVRAAVFAPAGVTRFGTLQPGQAVPGQALRYGDDGQPVVDQQRGGGRTPAGGWVLSPSDMVRILLAYDAGRIVSPASREAMLAPPEPPLKQGRQGAFGLGWDLVIHRRGKDGAVFYGKNGGIAGASAWCEHTFGGADFAAFYNAGNPNGAHRKGLSAVEQALDR